MEVSSVDSVDIDTLLLQQFSCMGTQDKEVLIKQFQALFGASEPARDVCVFYLEMNNWYFVIFSKHYKFLFIDKFLTLNL